MLFLFKAACTRESRRVLLWTEVSDQLRTSGRWLSASATYHHHNNIHCYTHQPFIMDTIVVLLSDTHVPELASYNVLGFFFCANNRDDACKRVRRLFFFLYCRSFKLFLNFFLNHHNLFLGIKGSTALNWTIWLPISFKLSFRNREFNTFRQI